ncbi:MAG: group 1 truncated hemoglobin [Planctomycetes bacterium]|nr:group 1 truncated hemoglobin [Planctomycetota bacterium]MCC7169143.1 group 1 truncated hemoglobin [Planctomycetota bacterium]
MTSLFERLGGQAAITTAVDVFYRKMLKDPRVARFFATTDMNRQRAKQAAFLTMVTGGPNAYTGKDMRAGHAHLVAQGLDDSHVDVVIEHLGATLAELGAKPEDIAQVAALANSVRDDVLNRASPSTAGR